MNCGQPNLYRNVRTSIRTWLLFEFVRSAFWPVIEPGNIHDYLAFSIKLHMGAIHGPRRRTFKVNPFAVVSAAVARAFEFVFTGLPIRRTAQMRAASVNHKQTI